MDKQFDAAIVGAGPAGAAAAITLCRAGMRVVAFEAGTFPHDKLCGEFLSPEGADQLLDLNVNVAQLGAHPMHSAQFLGPDGTSVAIPFPRPGWGISRRSLDSALARVAATLGADLRENSTVIGIHGELQSGFCLQIASGSKTSEIRSRVVIAAHGKRGALDRALNRPFIRHPQPMLALKRHYFGPPLNGKVVLHTFPGGYCGLAEIERGMINVCLLVREQVFRSASITGADRVEAFVHWMRTMNPHLAEWLERAEPVDARWLAIAQIPFEQKRQVVGDILMAGDAGGLIAPLAGDGIATALASGAMAARRCAEFLEGKGNRRQLTARYASDWERSFNPRIRLARLLQTIVLSPYLAPAALGVAAALPSLGVWLMRHTRNLEPRV